LEVRRQTTVAAENLLVNEGGNWQAVEAIRKCLPKLDVVSTLAFVIKAVDAVNAGTLVVTTKEEKVLRELDFVRKEKADCLEGLFATVNVITKEQVVGLWRKATILKHTK
jgi:hypothetical protein